MYILTQIAVIMWKLGYLNADHDKPAILAKALPFGETAHSMLGNLQQVNFSTLRLLPLDHDTYDFLEKEKKILAKG